ncbi:hypothetical protein K0M31_003626 [Melipona bicolor]|uniref:Uncharacterized protein n=1 Tax=Melipona bicolor TaxID=60889 RepID=A0AA40KPQ6_9HYME|nr:hypothetical protein K0M31_003626 [Melipona bicolor]
MFVTKYIKLRHFFFFLNTRARSIELQISATWQTTVAELAKEGRGTMEFQARPSIKSETATEGQMSPGGREKREKRLRSPAVCVQRGPSGIRIPWNVMQPGEVNPFSAPPSESR